MRVTSTIAPPDGSAPPAEITTDPDNWLGPALHAVVTDRDGRILSSLAVEAVETGNRDPINDVDDSRPPHRWQFGSTWMNQNPGELRVWLNVGADAQFNSNWVFIGADYPNGGTDPTFPPVPAPYLPLSQLLQPDPNPPIDWGALRLRARREMGVTEADTLIDSLLRERDLIRKTGPTFPIKVGDEIHWITLAGFELTPLGAAASTGG